MDGNKIALIFEELEQICSQYKEQVPGRRRAWPKAVKDRVQALRDLGVTGSTIAKKISIPYMTILSWQSGRESKRNAEFLPVTVKSEKKQLEASTVTVKAGPKAPAAPKPKPKTTTVTVVAPSGVRIEGVPIELALSLVGFEKPAAKL